MARGYVVLGYMVSGRGYRLCCPGLYGEWAWLEVMLSWVVR